MADIFSKKKRSNIMSKIRGKHTKPELTLRRAFAGKGQKYRLHYGKHRIDIAFPSRRVAVFVDGCFWHKCPAHFRMPKSNVAFWKKKILGNAKRDKRETKSLGDEGWKVIRIWEHDLRGGTVKPVARIKTALSRAKRKRF